MDNVTTQEMLSTIMNNNDLIVLNFTASWATPCQKQISILQDLSTTCNKIKFITIDTDQCEEIAATYKIRSVPSLLFIKDNQIVKTKIGLTSKEDIIDFLSKMHLLAFL